MKGIECAFVGRLGREPARRATKGGKAMTVLAVAVDGGDGAEATTWVRALAFEVAAEAAGELPKGAELYAEGRLKLEHWTEKEGAPRTGLTLLARLVQPLGRIGRRRPPAARKGNGAGDGHQAPAGAAHGEGFANQYARGRQEAAGAAQRGAEASPGGGSGQRPGRRVALLRPPGAAGGASPGRGGRVSTGITATHSTTSGSHHEGRGRDVCRARPRGRERVAGRCPDVSGADGALGGPRRTGRRAGVRPDRRRGARPGGAAGDGWSAQRLAGAEVIACRRRLAAIAHAAALIEGKTA